MWSRRDYVVQTSQSNNLSLFCHIGLAGVLSQNKHTNTIVLLAVGFVAEHVLLLITIEYDDLQQFNVVPFQQHTNTSISSEQLAHKIMVHRAQIKRESYWQSTSHYISAMHTLTDCDYNLFHNSSEMEFIVDRLGLE